MPVSSLKTSSQTGLRIAVGGGYRLLFKEHDHLPHVLSNEAKMNTDGSLRHGYALHLDAHYFFSKRFGAGIQANMSRSSMKATELYRNWWATMGVYFDYARRQGIYYFGPSFIYRLPLHRFTLLGEASVGGLFYRLAFDDKHSNNKLSILATSSHFGGYIGLGTEYDLGKHLALGVKISTNIGSGGPPKLKKGEDVLSDSNMEKLLGGKQSLSSLMVTVFLSFRTWK